MKSFRRRRFVPLVRLHLQVLPENSETASIEPSMEGLLLGRRDGHYVLAQARLLAGDQEQTLKGLQLIPAGRVYWLQELDRVELGKAGL